MDEQLLFWIKIFLEIGVIGTIVSILSITLFKKTKIVKYIFATTTLLLLLVIVEGIILLNPFPKSFSTSTKYPKISKVAPSKNISSEKPIVKKEVKQVPKPEKLEPTSNTEKSTSNQLPTIPNNPTELQSRAFVVAKIKSWGGIIEGAVKIVEEGFNQYYSFNVYEPSEHRYISVFVNTKTGELTNSDFGITNKWN